ncbi:MAG: hypothetical protein JSU06_07390 [Actinobacteria bacterium]|nr:hypothetical protein [Actinomycetota bacterium]
MPHVIAWCGFVGAWLLVAGPLDQAVPPVWWVQRRRLCGATTRLRMERRRRRPALDG